MPAVLQASISRDPAGAVTFLPSTVMFTSAMNVQSLNLRKTFSALTTVCIDTSGRAFSEMSELPTSDRNLGPQRFGHLHPRLERKPDATEKMLRQILQEPESTCQIASRKNRQLPGCSNFFKRTRLAF